jgi:YVTN family beta-propeller protein
MVPAWLVAGADEGNGAMMIQDAITANGRRLRNWLKASVVGLALLVAPAAARYQTIAVRVGKGPVDVAVNQATNMVYAANALSRTVTVIDGATNTVTASVPLAFEPAELLCDPTADLLFCRSADSPHLTKMNCGRDNQVSHIYLGSTDSCSAFCLNTSNGNVYCATGTRVLVVDGSAGEVVAEIPVPPNDWRDMLFDPVYNRVYCAGSDRVLVIDGAKNTVITGIPTGVHIHSLCLDSRRDRVYCAGPKRVIVIDAARSLFADKAQLARSPTGMMCYDPGANRVVCPETGKAGRVTLIDCTTGDTSSFRAGKGPQLSAIDPVGNRFFVLNRLSRDVSIIDGNTLDQFRIAVGSDPVALAVNPKTGQVYVANQNSNTVSVITDQPLKADIRIEGVTRHLKPSAFGTGAVTPIVVLSSTAPTTTGVVVRLEISVIPDHRAQTTDSLRIRVYLDSVRVWELMERSRVKVPFPEFAAEPGEYEVDVYVTDFADITPADNAFKLRWKFTAPPVPDTR